MMLWGRRNMLCAGSASCAEAASAVFEGARAKLCRKFGMDTSGYFSCPLDPVPKRLFRPDLFCRANSSQTRLHGLCTVYPLFGGRATVCSRLSNLESRCILVHAFKLVTGQN